MRPASIFMPNKSYYVSFETVIIYQFLVHDACTQINQDSKSYFLSDFHKGLFSLFCYQFKGVTNLLCSMRSNYRSI